MIALAILFSAIMVLLWIAFRLLQSFFDTYNSIHTGDKGRQESHRRAEVKEIKDEEKEIGDLMKEQLLELDRKFPPLGNEEGTPEQVLDRFTKNLGHMLRSNLKLFKSQGYDT